MNNPLSLSSFKSAEEYVEYQNGLSKERRKKYSKEINKCKEDIFRLKQAIDGENSSKKNRNKLLKNFQYVMRENAPRISIGQSITALEEDCNRFKPNKRQKWDYTKLEGIIVQTSDPVSRKLLAILGSIGRPMICDGYGGHFSHVKSYVRGYLRQIQNRKLTEGEYLQFLTMNPKEIIDLLAKKSYLNDSKTDIYHYEWETNEIASRIKENPFFSSKYVF